MVNDSTSSIPITAKAVREATHTKSVSDVKRGERRRAVSDYIKREDALAVIDRMQYRLEGNGLTYEILRDTMQKLPSADVVERETGEWMRTWHCRNGVANHEYRCSVCDEWQYAESRFCPNCGARMI